MRSLLLRAVLILALAFTLLVCALYPRLIAWVLLGLYLVLAGRRSAARLRQRRPASTRYSPRSTQAMSRG